MSQWLMNGIKAARAYKTMVMMDKNIWEVMSTTWLDFCRDKLTIETIDVSVGDDGSDEH